MMNRRDFLAMLSAAGLTVAMPPVLSSAAPTPKTEPPPLPQKVPEGDGLFVGGRQILLGEACLDQRRGVLGYDRTGKAFMDRAECRLHFTTMPLASRRAPAWWEKTGVPSAYSSGDEVDVLWKHGGVVLQGEALVTSVDHQWSGRSVCFRAEMIFQGAPHVLETKADG